MNHIHHTITIVMATYRERFRSAAGVKKQRIFAFDGITEEDTIGLSLMNWTVFFESRARMHG